MANFTDRKLPLLWVSIHVRFIKRIRGEITVQDLSSMSCALGKTQKPGTGDLGKRLFPSFFHPLPVISLLCPCVREGGAFGKQSAK